MGLSQKASVYGFGVGWTPARSNNNNPFPPMNSDQCMQSFSFPLEVGSDSVGS